MSSARGVVYAEFLIAFLCFFTLFVAALQLSVVATARLVVQHAAFQAVRAAVVTIDDDPVFYDGEPRKYLDVQGSGTKEGQGGVAAKALALVTKGANHTFTGLGARGSDRLNRVRNAAYLPLSVISPTAEQVARLVPFATSINPALAQRSILDDLGDMPLMRVVTGFGVYGRAAAAITFPTAPGAQTLRDSLGAAFGDRDLVTVRVTYLLPCNVPLGRELVCDNLMSATGLPQALRKSVEAIRQPSVKAFEQAYDSWARTPGALKSLKRDLSELMRAEWASLQLAMYLRSSERFIVLRGEASLPNHGAPYKYHSELQSKGGSP